MLLAIAFRTRSSVLPLAGSWAAAALLAVYALPFAFAYTQLSTGTGALILFGCVQVTMLIAALGSGERPHAVQWAGLSIALAGLVNLVLPGLTAPSLTAAALMGIAGVCWGLYSLQGRRTSNALLQTTGNFVRAVPLIGAASLLGSTPVHVEARGVALAVASGAVGIRPRLRGVVRRASRPVCNARLRRAARSPGDCRRRGSHPAGGDGDAASGGLGGAGAGRDRYGDRRRHTPATMTSRRAA